MNWPFRRREAPPSPRLPHAYPVAPDPDDDDPGAVASLPTFACSTCGRTDLDAAGDWDPPICEECDAAINFDIEREEIDAEEHE
jgi:hypothetical protein